MDKKGQVSLSINDAPSVVLVVGLTFLVMATIAVIAFEYGDAIPASYTYTVVNETITQAEREAATAVSNHSACNFERFSVVDVINATTFETIPSSNYTAGTNYITNTTGMGNQSGSWLVTYSYYYAGTACDVNQELQTEINNNTSIAGLLLTIALISIILSLLLGVFLVMRNRGM